MSEEIIENDNKQVDLPLSLGQMLREKREKNGISMEDVADQLRISYSVIKNIESDAYSVKEMNIFIRGYIRNYAKLVDLDLKEVDSAFLHLGLKKVPSSAKAKPANFKVHPRKKQNRIVRIITYFIVVILVGLVFIWRYSHHMSDNNIITTSSSEQVRPIASQDINAPADIAGIADRNAENGKQAANLTKEQKTENLPSALNANTQAESGSSPSFKESEKSVQ